MNAKKQKVAALKRYQAESAKLQKLPVPVRTRSGCKVSWMIYATEDEAKLASKHALLSAEFKASEGYDFGYCSPGSIAKVHDGWEVCFP